jgi:hypothetical protein
MARLDGMNGSSQGSHQVSMEKTAWDVVHLLDNLLMGHRPGETQLHGWYIQEFFPKTYDPLCVTWWLGLPLDQSSTNFRRFSVYVLLLHNHCRVCRFTNDYNSPMVATREYQEKKECQRKI